MLALDTVGRFSHRLVVATGRSGNQQPAGGTVYTIDANAKVRRIGAYAGPGGADAVAVAPAGFGAIAGWALLAADAGASGGTIVAMDPRGRTRTIARLPDGPNPIAVVTRHGSRSAAASGFYVADTNTQNVYLAHAPQLAPYAGELLVGSELKARFWIVRPRGQGFVMQELKTDLPPAQYNLEGADYIP
jgi:hypothetical protein